MKCFIHSAKEAVAACRNCGKGMCQDCSAYSGHTGVCPECKKEEYEIELGMKLDEQKSLLWAKIGWIVVAVGLSWTVIFLLVGAVKAFKRHRERKETLARIDWLNKEIEKLNYALKQGSAII